ncbi:succinate dehydrogenase, hydrophobic membrane anchor protein [Thiomonas sp. FB-Cd]|uniref:succinate dehydrogenase, hydrophobic membrane anchor protein n=1 Tax=Thiomonas sp. FB-Cd TaxID=1158292 RepID=UPI0004DF720E|nr:succinate dehydrogenase, hydrophobic membrane anchor protein [Thiomonas sp. FB-Cd]
MSASNYGAHRLVVGAHYGFRDWLAQRVTAVIMAVYTIFLLGWFVGPGPLSYESWQGLFSNEAMKIFSLVALLALLYHVWVGMRDIWMDYVKPVWVRLSLQVLTIVWLVACTGWAVQVLWRV